MKRLVYSPRVDAYVKADSGIYDLSPYIVSCTVNRKSNQVSKATVTLRNPEFMWTKAKVRAFDGSLQEGPVFHPQDPIIITMTRLADRPVQVFTGYCDTTPYLQLFPGPCVIEASCTLKRLLYTYWDPGLPFVWQFLQSVAGWQINPQQGLVNPQAEFDSVNGAKHLTDSSIGNLLFAVLETVGKWDTNNIHIEALPPNIGDFVVKLFQTLEKDNEQAEGEIKDLLTNMIGGKGYGTAPSANNDQNQAVVGTGQFQPCQLTWYDPALGGTNSGSGKKNPFALTASGEPYNPLKLTCAAPPNYPFGTMIEFKVGNKSLVAKVNDRGGAIQGAHFDLSRAAGEQLGVGNTKGEFRIAKTQKAKT